MRKCEITSGSSRERVEFTKWVTIREFVSELAEKGLISVEGLVPKDSVQADLHINDTTNVYVWVEKKELGEVLLARKKGRKLREEQIEEFKQKKKRDAYRKASQARKISKDTSKMSDTSKRIRIGGFNGEMGESSEILRKRGSAQVDLGEQEPRKKTSKNSHNQRGQNNFEWRHSRRTFLLLQKQHCTHQRQETQGHRTLQTKGDSSRTSGEFEGVFSGGIVQVHST